MASKKTKKITEIDENAIVSEEKVKNTEVNIADKVDEAIAEQKEPTPVIKTVPVSTPTIALKAKIGDIVYVSKDADTDLNGFKLFPQYKKYTYTVEDYNPVSDVYSLRRANLLLSLKGEFIVRPEERAHDSINRMQF